METGQKTSLREVNEVVRRFNEWAEGRIQAFTELGEWKIVMALEHSKDKLAEIVREEDNIHFANLCAGIEQG